MTKSRQLNRCPCGKTPSLPSGDGTQYEIYCDCGMTNSCVQICDLMSLDERLGDDFIGCRYQQIYIDRARDKAIENWNRIFNG